MRRAIILVGCVFNLIASSGESSDSFTLSVVGNEKQNVVEAQHSDATVIISNKNRSVVTPPLVEFNQNGDAVAVWQSLDQNNRLVLVGAFYTEEGGWENSQVISELTEKINPGDYKIRFHDDANGSISWRSLTKSKDRKTDQFRLRSASFDFESWSKPQTILENCN